MQTLIVALLVVFCSAYAAWTLMPAAARRGAAGALLKLPLPQFFAASMRRAAAMSAGRGCAGCAHAPVKSAPRVPQVIAFHPRSKP